MIPAGAMDSSVERLTINLDEVGPEEGSRVGGKGANLGALTRAGVSVPPGFCVTTAAYQRFLAALSDAPAHFSALDALDGSDADAARLAAEAMRAALHRLPVPEPIAAAVREAWRALGPEHPLAVRSSATAEDLPGASFAGQQDTFLNVCGEAALLDAVRRCWISLFTDRAVLYRARGGFGHRAVSLAVVVQRLVEPDVAGILFTADPVSGHRGVASIDAGLGLGEALVGGLISADLYRVDRRRREVLVARPGDQAFAIRSEPGGGTRREPLAGERRTARVLDDAQVLALADIGERVEAHFGGAPQDIEWCLAGGRFYVVQARPITSLFPIPRSAGAGGDGLRIFASFGHVQMMLDAMPRLALEVWQYFFPVGKGGAPDRFKVPRLSPVLPAAAGRLYIDVTGLSRVPRLRRLYLGVLEHIYEALARGIEALCARTEFQESSRALPRLVAEAALIVGPVVSRFPLVWFVFPPEAGARAAHLAIERLQADARERISRAPTPAARLRQAMRELNGVFAQVRRHLARLGGGILAHGVLRRLARAPWADGVRDEVDQLLRGLPGNVTTEMDLAVGDLADLVRPHGPLAALVREASEQRADGPSWIAARGRLGATDGGPAFLSALDTFLERYGDRGAGEIDVSRARWKDDPSLLLRVIAGASPGGEPGAHRRHHRAQAAQGEAAAAALSRAARGPLRGFVVRRLVRVVRASVGLREHPKFMLVRVLGVVRAEALAAGVLLASRGQLLEAQQVFHLAFDEVLKALEDAAVDLKAVAAEREEEHRRNQARRPPFVISSDGETPTLAPVQGELPSGALAGTAASSGVVEGIARVVKNPDRQTLHAGEILVAPFTDPGWTPLFVHAAGVVTEVGGLMTHGAVVAREYGIPAVVSVSGALERIRDGQRIRVDGTRGIVELLEDP